MELFFLWLLCPILGAAMLSRYNGAGTGFLLGLIFGPIGLIFALVIRSDKSKDEQNELHEEQIQALAASKDSESESKPKRECPYCAETILVKAKICKHCGRDVKPITDRQLAAVFRHRNARQSDE